jgi:hypothetical protein
MPAPLLNGPRPFFMIVGAFVALAPGMSSGCGGGSTATPVPDASTHKEAGAILEMVVTTGGGAPDSGGTVVNPFGPQDSGSASDDSGTGSDGSGLMSDGSSSSGGSNSDGSSSSSSGGSDSGADGPTACDPYTPPMCGTVPCDLRSNTCCVQFDLTARCLAGNNATCNSNEATVHCLQACECGGSDVCCGQVNEILGAATSSCNAISSLASGPSGALECPPYPATSEVVGAQLCKTDAECENGAPCVAQTCMFGAMLTMCGVQNQSGFTCTAN